MIRVAETSYLECHRQFTKCSTSHWARASSQPWYENSPIVPEVMGALKRLQTTLKKERTKFAQSYGKAHLREGKPVPPGARGRPREAVVVSNGHGQAEAINPPPPKNRHRVPCHPAYQPAPRRSHSERARARPTAAAAAGVQPKGPRDGHARTGTPGRGRDGPGDPRPSQRAGARGRGERQDAPVSIMSSQLHAQQHPEGGKPAGRRGKSPRGAAAAPGPRAAAPPQPSPAAHAAPPAARPAAQPEPGPQASPPAPAHDAAAPQQPSPGAQATPAEAGGGPADAAAPAAGLRAGPPPLLPSAAEAYPAGFPPDLPLSPEQCHTLNATVQKLAFDMLLQQTVLAQQCQPLLQSGEPPAPPAAAHTLGDVHPSPFQPSISSLQGELSSSLSLQHLQQRGLPQNLLYPLPQHHPVSAWQFSSAPGTPEGTSAGPAPPTPKPTPRTPSDPKPGGSAAPPPAAGLSDGLSGRSSQTYSTGSPSERPSDDCKQASLEAVCHTNPEPGTVSGSDLQDKPAVHPNLTPDSETVTGGDAASAFRDDPRAGPSGASPEGGLERQPMETAGPSGAMQSGGALATMLPVGSAESPLADGPGVCCPGVWPSDCPTQSPPRTKSGTCSKGAARGRLCPGSAPDGRATWKAPVLTYRGGGGVVQAGISAFQIL